MTAQLVYQNFGMEVAQPSQPAEVQADDLEDAKLEAFEKGYQSGWDDAISAQADLERTVSSALADNLQDASFQYHELRTQLCRAVQSIMQAVVDNVLPNMARNSLGVWIAQSVEQYAQKSIEGMIEVHVHPGAVNKVKALIENSNLDQTVVGDPEVAPDQAFISFGTSEREIDLGAMRAEIENAVNAYFETQLIEDVNDG